MPVKGLVKIKIPNSVIGDPTRDPVDKQAALLLRKAKWLELPIPEPLPPDPDLTNRQVVLKYLKERTSLMSKISRLEREQKAFLAKIAHLSAMVDRDREKRNNIPPPAFVSPEAILNLCDDVRARRQRNAQLSTPDLNLEIALREFEEKLRRIANEEIQKPT